MGECGGYKCSGLANLGFDGLNDSSVDGRRRCRGEMPGIYRPKDPWLASRDKEEELVPGYSEDFLMVKTGYS